MIQNCAKSDESGEFLFKNKHPIDTGKIINDIQTIFGTTIRFI
jgi:hypothetical protein